VVIGGAGFIGHHLALHLRSRGAEVTIIDGMQVNNLLSLIGNPEKAPHRNIGIQVVNQRLLLLQQAGIPLFGQDAREYHALSHLLSELRPHVVVHLAAVAHAGQSNKDPFSTFDHSLRTLENALDWSRGRAERFVFLSSSMVYGNFNGREVEESAVCEPIGIYGALKFAGEKLVIAYNQVFDLPYTIIRPSALYGERCISRRVGQVFIESALFDNEIEVQGDGSESLDFTYIDDLIVGMTLAIESDDARNEVFNLTYGSARTLAQMTDILRDYFPNLKLRCSPRDRLMPERGTLSINKARALLGYHPEWPLERGYPRYIAWYRELFQQHPQLWSGA
jgi:nucleoside-diphosphate-sugar epimerase